MLKPTRRGRPPLPESVEAECFICGQQFRTLHAYFRHRFAVNVPFTQRTCRVFKPETTHHA